MLVCVMLFEFVHGTRHVVGAMRVVSVVMRMSCQRQTTHQTVRHDDVSIPSLELSEFTSHDPTTSAAGRVDVTHDTSHDDMHAVSVSASPDITSHRVLPRSASGYGRVDMKEEEHVHDMTHEHAHEIQHDDMHDVAVTTTQLVTKAASPHAQSASAAVTSTVPTHQRQYSASISLHDHDIDDSAPMMHAVMDSSAHPSDDIPIWSVVPPRYHTWRIPIAILTVIALSCLCTLVMLINIKNAISDGGMTSDAANNGTNTTTP